MPLQSIQREEKTLLDRLRIRRGPRSIPITLVLSYLRLRGEGGKANSSPGPLPPVPTQLGVQWRIQAIQQLRKAKCRGPIRCKHDLTRPRSPAIPFSFLPSCIVQLLAVFRRLISLPLPLATLRFDAIQLPLIWKTRRSTRPFGVRLVRWSERRG